MKPNREFDVFAAIDTGSYSIKMKICQVNSNSETIVLENPRKNINLGKDTFTLGYITAEKAGELCFALEGFNRLLNEYKVDKTMIVATSALREASNCEYILDYVYRNTDIRINVINEAEERYYTYGAILDNLSVFTRLKKDGLLIADVSSGGVEITLFKEKQLAFTQYIQMGSLRLKEMLADLESKTLNYPNLIGEFIESEMDTVKVFLENNPVDNFLIIGSEVATLHDILSRHKKSLPREFISKDVFENIFQQIAGRSQKQIMEKYMLPADSAETLVPALLMYNKFLSYTKADKIYTPLVSLCDGLIKHMTDKHYGLKNESLSHKDIVYLVKNIGRRYNYDEKHAEYVEKISMKLFDSTASLHGFGEHEKLLLRIASIAHDFGKFVNIKSHNIISGNIILSSDIIGLSKRDLLITEGIIKYHANKLPDLSEFINSSLGSEGFVTISKLSSFLKIADALDRSHKQKISGISVIIEDRTMEITAYTAMDSLLEEWEFENKKKLFCKVYAIEPELIIKRV